MKKLLNISCVLLLVLGLFFSVIPVSYADPIDDAVDFGTGPYVSESSTHESSSSNTHGGIGGRLEASEATTTTSNPYFQDTEYVGENFCSEPTVKKVLKFFGFIVLLLKFIVPILIIIKGMFLFYNAMVKGGSDDLSKNAKALGVKIIIGILIFFIPDLLNGILDLYEGWSTVKSDYTNCADCLLDPTNKCS